MTHDALIFDIDGTLWNASPASAAGWNEGLAKLGIAARVTAGQIASVAGNPYEKCVEILLPGMMARHPALLATLNECERASLRSMGGAFYDGVIDGIKELAGWYPIFLVSNCQAWYLELFLEHSGLGPALAGCDCYGLSGSPKEKMLSRMQRDHCLHHPVYIGDTASDERAAALASMPFLHVSYGFGTPINTAASFGSFPALRDHLQQPCVTL